MLVGRDGFGVRLPVIGPVPGDAAIRAGNDVQRYVEFVIPAIFARHLCFCSFAQFVPHGQNPPHGKEKADPVRGSVYHVVYSGVKGVLDKARSAGRSNPPAGAWPQRLSSVCHLFRPSSIPLPLWAVTTVAIQRALSGGWCTVGVSGCQGAVESAFTSCRGPLLHAILGLAGGRSANVGIPRVS